MSGMRDRLQRIERGLEVPQVDVLELVNWVYSEQRAHQAEHRGSDLRLLLGSGISADGVARIAELNILGCRVDVSGSDAGELHPVAETVHFLAGQIQARHQAPAWLLAHYGAQKALPPGYDLDLDLGPTWKGEPRYELGRCTGCGKEHTMPRQKAFQVVHDGSNAKVPLYCPLEWSHGADYQAELRREYEHWHLALRCLVEACAKADLGRLVVTGPAIAREPWLDRGEVTLQREPSREVESKPTRSSAEDWRLSILLDAHNGNVTIERGKWWRSLGSNDGMLIGEAMVSRLANQGLAAYRLGDGNAVIGLDVTAAGLAALRAARLVPVPDSIRAG
jgi:hypothetical protein